MEVNRMSKEGTAVLDMLVTTLMEHEKDLDMIVDKLERIVAKLNRVQILATRSQIEGTETDFMEVVGETLMKLPKGYSFSIPKVTHTAYVKVTWTEPNTCSQKEEG